MDMTAIMLVIIGLLAGVFIFFKVRKSLGKNDCGSCCSSCKINCDGKEGRGDRSRVPPNITRK